MPAYQQCAVWCPIPGRFVIGKAIGGINSVLAERFSTILVKNGSESPTKHLKKCSCVLTLRKAIKSLTLTPGGKLGMLRPYGCVEFAFRVGIVSVWCCENVLEMCELDKMRLLSKSETTPRNITADIGVSTGIYRKFSEMLGKRPLRIADNAPEMPAPVYQHPRKCVKTPVLRQEKGFFCPLCIGSDPKGQKTPQKKTF